MIALITHQDTVALIGDPLYRYIEIENSEQILRAIEKTDETLLLADFSKKSIRQLKSLVGGNLRYPENIDS